MGSHDVKPDPGRRPGPIGLFFIFTQIALTSFGGGLSAWMLRVFVQERKWISERDFLNGLSLSQALPGVNVKNMAIWIGYSLLGFRGAVAGFLGVIVPPAILVVLLGTALSSLGRFEIVHIGLEGAAAAAVGMSLFMGITAARGVPRRLLPLCIMVGTFIAVGILHWSLVLTVLIAGGIGIGFAYVTLPRPG
jgi:chromate transporter